MSASHASHLLSTCHSPQRCPGPQLRRPRGSRRGPPARCGPHHWWRAAAARRRCPPGLGTMFYMNDLESGAFNKHSWNINIHKMLQMIFNSLNIHGTSPPINWIILVQLADHFFRETQITSCGEERWLACQVFPFFPESWRANLQSLTSHMFSLLR